MFFISHRGNLSGKERKFENDPNYINHALDSGFDVEIDIRYFKSKLYLGHDEPQFKTDIEYLSNNKLWCHAKDIQSAEILSKNTVHFFYHESDAITLTSRGYFWTYPGQTLNKKSICVMPEIIKKKQDLKICSGICSDYIKKYKASYD